MPDNGRLRQGVSRPRLGAAADQVRVLRAEPGRDAAFAVGDDERMAVPCADSMTSTRNSKSRFACRWLRARATTYTICCLAEWLVTVKLV